MCVWGGVCVDGRQGKTRCPPDDGDEEGWTCHTMRPPHPPSTHARHPLQRNLCKHILFVMLRVLRLSPDDPLVWQRALLTKEVNAVLSGAHSINEAGTTDQVCGWWGGVGWAGLGWGGGGGFCARHGVLNVTWPRSPPTAC